MRIERGFISLLIPNERPAIYLYGKMADQLQNRMRFTLKRLAINCLFNNCFININFFAI